MFVLLELFVQGIWSLHTQVTIGIHGLIKVQTFSVKTGCMRLYITEYLHWTSAGYMNSTDILDRFVIVLSILCAVAASLHPS